LSGVHFLNMAHPAKRAFLRLLVFRFCDGHQGVAIHQLLRGATLQHGATATQVNTSRWRRNGSFLDLPTEGTLQFELYAGEALAMFGSDDIPATPEMALECAMRQKIELVEGASKELAVLSLVKGSRQEAEWQGLLEALSRDFRLTASQIEALCQTQLKQAGCAQDPGRACTALLPCLVDAKQVRRLIMKTAGIYGCMQVHNNALSLLSFIAENPTGHYNLLLEDPVRRTTAVNLLLLNRWEVLLVRRANRPDISQLGNWKNLRNVMYQHVSWSPSAEEWQLPGPGTLSFDYVSLLRPGQKAEAVTEDAWIAVLHSARGQMFRQKHGTVPYDTDAENLVVWTFRQISAKIWITSVQLRELLCIVCSPGARMDLLAYFINRVIDWPVNGKMCWPKFNTEIMPKLRRRLGDVILFPFLQPESTNWRFDLSSNEERRVLHQLVCYCMAEDTICMRNARIDWACTGTWNTFELGVPHSWVTWENVPTRGFLEVKYACSPDVMKLRVRVAAAINLGGWSSLPAEDKIQKMLRPWAVLEEVPTEVLSVLEWMASKGHTKEQVFQACDAINSDMRLTMSEFVSGLLMMGFQPAPDPVVAKEASPATGKTPRRQMTSSSKVGNAADGPGSPTSPLANFKAGSRSVMGGALSKASHKNDEHVRSILTGAYRFLDPNNDGSVTVSEWAVFDGMWRELMQTMWEFVHHLKETFGNLQEAWHFADEDGSGSLDFAEFSSLARKWHFDGPIRQAFMAIDQDSSGLIGEDEWVCLQTISRFEG